MDDLLEEHLKSDNSLDNDMNYNDNNEVIINNDDDSDDIHSIDIVEYSDIIYAIINTSNEYFIKCMWIESECLNFTISDDLLKSCRNIETYSLVLSLINNANNANSIINTNDTILYDILNMDCSTVDDDKFNTNILSMLNCGKISKCEKLYSEYNHKFNLGLLQTSSTEGFKWICSKLSKLRKTLKGYNHHIVSNVDINVELLQWVYANHKKIITVIFNMNDLILRGKFDCIEYLLSIDIQHITANSAKKNIKYLDTILIELSSNPTNIVSQMIKNRHINTLKHIFETYYSILDWDKLIDSILSSGKSKLIKFMLNLDFNKNNKFQDGLPSRWIDK